MSLQIHTNNIEANNEIETNPLKRQHTMNSNEQSNNNDSNKEQSDHFSIIIEENKEYEQDRQLALKYDIIHQFCDPFHIKVTDEIDKIPSTKTVSSPVRRQQQQQKQTPQRATTTDNLLFKQPIPSPVKKQRSLPLIKSSSSPTKSTKTSTSTSSPSSSSQSPYISEISNKLLQNDLLSKYGDWTNKYINNTYGPSSSSLMNTFQSLNKPTNFDKWKKIEDQIDTILGCASLNQDIDPLSNFYVNQLKRNASTLELEYQYSQTDYLGQDPVSPIQTQQSDI